LEPLKMTKPAVMRDTIDGRQVAFVPLGDGRFAVVDAVDFDQLVAAGVSANWHIGVDDRGADHVRIRSAKPERFPVVSVARLITGAGPRERITFRDGDRLNLRRENLRVSPRKPGAALTSRTEA